MVDDVSPGSVGQGEPLKGATLTVTSKNFSENIILGAMIGLVFKAAGAEVLDRTEHPGLDRRARGDRQAVTRTRMYEYTGTGLDHLPGQQRAHRRPAGAVARRSATPT